MTATSPPLSPLGGRSSRSALLAVIAAVVLAVAAGAVIGLLSPSNELLLLVATAATLLAPVAWRAATGQLDIFEPLVPFVLAYGVMFVVRPAYMLATNVQYYEITEVPVAISSKIVTMQVVALIGAIAFVVGYELRLGERVARRLPRAPRPPASSLGNFGWILFIFGAVLTALYIRSQGGLGAIFAGRSEAYFQSVAGTSKYLYYAPTLMVPAALLMFGAWRESHRHTFLIGAALSVVVLFAARGPVGGRIAFLPLVGGVIIYLYLERRKRPGVLAAGAVLLAAISISAVIGEVRNAGAREQQGLSGTVAALVAAPERVFTPLTEGPDAAMAPGLAAALTVMPSEVGHTYGGATFGDLAFRAIPRSVWPEKPRPPREEVVALLWSDGYRVGAANPEFSVLFAWYSDAASFGVMIGLLLYGLLARGAWGYFKANEMSMATRLAYAAFAPSIVMALRDTPTDSFVRLLFSVAPILAAAFIVGRPGRGSRRVNAV
ncbi:hypothetical protein LRS13_19765 [Svornostia abyssi]|uniref:Oligosaccharide repeat unit polymerase n=1 Tax=Svornostia abyssi TaxID=2898438 RepID=A0ABY5PE07_9ACTN|nr:hypothetical protein LRS13_19765 [Parviterribacteraceae bacterium J379]